MSKLLSANFYRMIKTKFFWISIISVIAAAAFYPVLFHYTDMPASNCFGSINFFILLAMLFCAMFIGTDYSDGTIRNKIVLGHTKTSIYLANFITCLIQNFILCALHILVYCCVDVLIFDNSIPKIKEFLLLIMITVMLEVAFTSIYTLISMSCENKSNAFIICFVCLFALAMSSEFIGIQVDNSFNEMMQKPYELINSMFPEEFQLQMTNLKNLNEVKNGAEYGMKEKILKFLYDFLPSGQSFQLKNLDENKAWLLALYSGIIAAATNFTGIFVFHKKDLK